MHVGKGFNEWRRSVSRRTVPKFYSSAMSSFQATKIRLIACNYCSSNSAQKWINWREGEERIFFFSLSLVWVLYNPPFVSAVTIPCRVTWWISIVPYLSKANQWHGESKCEEQINNAVTQASWITEEGYNHYASPIYSASFCKRIQKLT